MDRLFPSPVPSLAGGGLRAFAVGVSGGADSMALALLLHQWSLPRAIAVQAVTVDHALRPEMAAESAALCDRPELIELEDNTHWVQHEAAALVNETLITRFSSSAPT